MSRATGQQIAGIQRRTLRSQLEQRVTTQRVGVIAVFITRGDLKYALGQQIAQGVGDVTRITGIGNGSGQAINQADTTIHGTQYQGTQVRGYFPAGEIAANRVASSRRKSELLWGKIGSRAGTCRHFLRIGVWITPIISNACRDIRPVYAKSRLVMSAYKLFQILSS